MVLVVHGLRIRAVPPITLKLTSKSYNSPNTHRTDSSEGPHIGFVSISKDEIYTICGPRKAQLENIAAKFHTNRQALQRPSTTHRHVHVPTRPDRKGLVLYGRQKAVPVGERRVRLLVHLILTTQCGNGVFIRQWVSSERGGEHSVHLPDVNGLFPAVSAVLASPRTGDTQYAEEVVSSMRMSDFIELLTSSPLSSTARVAHILQLAFQLQLQLLESTIQTNARKCDINLVSVNAIGFF